MLLAPAVALAAAPEYRTAACPGDYAGIAQTVTCGILVVDETRGSSNGRRVVLPVAVVKALKPRAGAVPVIFLHGGPGGGAVDSLPDALRAARGKELHGQDQDWIFFDQRGGVLSVPSLDCGSSLPLNDAGPLSEAAANGLIGLVSVKGFLSPSRATCRRCSCRRSATLALRCRWPRLRPGVLHDRSSSCSPTLRTVC